MIRALKEGGNLAALTGGDPHNLHSGRTGAWKAKIKHYAKQINSSDQRSLFIFSKNNWIRKRANAVIEWKWVTCFVQANTAFPLVLSNTWCSWQSSPIVSSWHWKNTFPMKTKQRWPDLWFVSDREDGGRARILSSRKRRRFTSLASFVLKLHWKSLR